MKLAGLILCVLFFNLCVFGRNAPFDFYQLKGEQEGSSLLVIGGIHGDEPGAYFAPALLFQYYMIKKGNVYVIPNLNPDSILAFKRGVYKDMNRKFAHIDIHDPDYENVKRVKEIIKDDSVDFIVNLHDGHGFYRQKWENSIFNPKAWGQTYVIDQKTIDSVKFNNLDDIAKQMEIKLNESLHYDFHIFGVRNTETKFKDEEQQNSLTFFAITNFKPALAIETSKNINELDLKVFYQLSSIEALMDILGIEYERNFVMTLEGIREKILEYGTLRINNNIVLDLKGIKPELSYFPLKKNDNIFIFTHPLGRVKPVKNGYEVYIGHRKITTLRPQFFVMDCTKDSIEISVDGKNPRVAKFGSILEFYDGFFVHGEENLRVNVVGYTQKDVMSEDNIYVKAHSLDKNYAIDKDKRTFRVEVYNNENFCGLVSMKHSIKTEK